MISKKKAVLCGERGEGKIGAIIALLVVVLAIHVGVKIIPHKVHTAEFEKSIEDDLLDLAANMKLPDAFMLSVLEKAKAMEIPVREDMIKLELVGATWEFETKYEVPLKMIWGDWVQTVEINRSRTRL